MYHMLAFLIWLVSLYINLLQDAWPYLHIVSYLYCQMGYQENELGICRANAKNSRKNSRTDNSKLEFILCDCKCTRLLLMEVPM